MTTEPLDRPGVVKAFERALTREAHVLEQRPDLTWQQLHNQLQWEADKVRTLVAAERSHGGSGAGSTSGRQPGAGGLTAEGSRGPGRA